MEFRKKKKSIKYLYNFLLTLEFWDKSAYISFFKQLISIQSVSCCMNRFVTIMISVFLLQTIFSCSHKSDTKLYTKNAILVIEKILSEEYPCDCLIIKSSEEGLANTERRISIKDQERLIMSELDFYSKKEFLSAIALFESFELDTLSNYPKIKILKSKTLDSIYKKSG